MNEGRDAEGQRRWLGWLAPVMVILVLWAVVLLQGQRSRENAAKAQLAQAADQLITQANLARADWLLHGKPQPLQWRPAAVEGEPLPLYLDEAGRPLLDERQGCGELWLALLRRPLLLLGQTSLTVSAGHSQQGHYCDYVGDGHQLRWWPHSGVSELSTQPTDQ
ncbi:MAG: hypothetical protein II007_08750 [Gammaproteobacteria bacterium]|nr:hypothetical protein [Gammaproteobacteria bacterium]